MDKIRGPNFGTYDARYLRVTQRQKPQTVKPNVFKGIDDNNKLNTALQNLTKDIVSLSPEAKQFIKLLKKYGRKSSEVKKFLEDKENRELIYSFKELRDLVYEDEDEYEYDPLTGKKRKKKKGKPAVPNQMVYQLSVKPRARGRGSHSASMDWNQLRELIDNMIVFSPSEDVKKTLVLELEPLGDKIVRMVKSFGTRIVILPKEQSLVDLKIRGMSIVAPGEKTFDGRPWKYVRGLYDNSRRIMVIGEENIGNKRHSTARHEFAHAFDHTFSETNYRRLPLSVQLWNRFSEQRGGLVSNYAGTNPMEYFAESVEAFFRQSGKENLSQSDPLMYDYLEKLFYG